MNPYRLKDVFEYLTSNNQLLKRKLKLGTDEIPIPPKRSDVTTIEAINRFNKANPRVDTTNLKPLSVKQSNVKQSNVDQADEGVIQGAFDTATREAQSEGFPAPKYEAFKKRYLRKNMKADGGRIGYKDGPKMFDVQASGSKTGKQQIENAPEGITSDKETINAILTMDIPLTEKVNLIGNLKYGKFRDRIEYKDDEIFLDDPKSYRNRNIGLDYNRGGEGFSGSATVGDEGPEFNIRYKKSFADGGRIGFLKGQLVRQGPNTGKVAVRDLKLIKNKEGKITNRLTAYFKDMDAANAAIQKHKEGESGQLKFKKSKKILNDPKLKAEFLKYSMGKDVTGKMIRKKYNLSNEEFFYGGLRDIIDKDFLQYSKSQALKANTIKNMLLLHNDKLSKDYIRNGLIVPDDIVAKLGLNMSEAATATARLSQHYSGMDFGFKELKSIRRNNKAGSELFASLNNFKFGNPYRSNLYKISLQLIDDQLGNEQGTFGSLKKKAAYILKKNKIKGFDINEIAGVTGTAKTGVGEFSQFIDVMDSNLNQKQMASFQAAFSVARQNILNDANSFTTESKKINKLAGIFEREYGVKLPRIRALDDVEKYYSPKRLEELKNQGLDIKAASKKLGYTVQMPSGATTINEFVGDQKIQAKVLRKMGFKCKFAGSNGGLGSCDDPASYIDDINKTQADINSDDPTVRNKAIVKNRKALDIAKTIPKIGKFVQKAAQVGASIITTPLKALGLTSPIGVAIEGAVEGGIYDYYRAQGYNHNQAYAETFTPKAVTDAVGITDTGVGAFEGAQKLLDAEKFGAVQYDIEGNEIGIKTGNPEGLAKQYSDLYKNYEQEYNKYANIANSLDQIKSYGGPDLNNLEQQLKIQIANVNRAANAIKPGTPAYEAFQIAEENQAGRMDNRRREYLEKTRGTSEPSEFQNLKKEKERGKEMIEMFPMYTPEITDSMYKQANIKQPENFDYNYFNNMMRDQDKMDYFADNFRLEKASGGIASLTKTIPPESGPTPHGLPYLYNNVKKI